MNANVAICQMTLLVIRVFFLKKTASSLIWTSEKNEKEGFFKKKFKKNHKTPSLFCSWAVDSTIALMYVVDLLILFQNFYKLSWDFQLNIDFFSFLFQVSHVASNSFLFLQIESVHKR